MFWAKNIFHLFVQENCNGTADVGHTKLAMLGLICTNVRPRFLERSDV